MTVSQLDVALDRPMPQSPDAERAVLGSILTDAGAFHRVTGIVAVGDFFKDTHRTLFAAMRNLADQGREIDVLTVKEELAKCGTMEQAGGSTYVSSLMSAPPDVANVELYAYIVKEKATLRRLIMMGNSVMRAALDNVDTPEEIASKFALGLTNLASERMTLASVCSTVHVAVLDIEARAVSGDHVTGVPFGLPELDGYTLGIQRGVESLLAARPRVGKTAMALAIALHNARAKRRVLFVELDMSEQMIGKRIIASTSGVAYAKIRSGQFISPAEWRQIAAAEQELAALDRSLMFDYATRDLAKLSAAIRVEARNGLDLIIVDHIGHVSGVKAEKRYLEVGGVSSRFIELARDTGAALLSLVQLGRDAEEREPTLSDLRESGNLEQDARLVVMLDRPHIRGDANYHECVLRLLVPKNEGEAGGKMDAHFDGEVQRVTQEATKRCRYCSKEQAVSPQMKLQA